jgi:UDP-glucose 4-epimerase
MNKQKTALILGANGYLGRHLVLHLKQQNWQLFRSDIGDAAKDSFGGLHYVQANLTSYDEMFSLPLDVDYIYFFTGLTGTSAAFTKYPDFVNSNEITLLNLLKALREVGSKAKIIFPSTRLVYKGLPNTPLKEDAEKDFKTVYAINKFACEQYLQMWGNAFGQAYSIVRICVPYGNLLDSNYSYGTLGFFLNKAAAGEPISLYGDGELRRTFSHVADISRYFEEVALHPNTTGQTYNFGGDNCSLKEVATAIAKKANVAIQYTPFPPLDAAIESGDTIFDSTKLDTLINFKQEYSVMGWLDSLPKLR